MPSVTGWLRPSVRRLPRWAPKESPFGFALAERAHTPLCKASLVQGRAHPLARATERTSTPSVVATAEWVLWVGIVWPYSAIGMRTPAEHEAAWASDTNQDRK